MGAHSKASNYFHSFMSSFISMLDLSYTIYEYLIKWALPNCFMTATAGSKPQSSVL